MEVEREIRLSLTLTAMTREEKNSVANVGEPTVRVDPAGGLL